MKKDTLQKVISNDPELNRLQDALVPRFNAVARDSLLNRQGLAASFSGAGALTIIHNLGRIPSGWMLTDLTASAIIWRSAWTEDSITLNASAAADIDFFVF